MSEPDRLCGIPFRSDVVSVNGCAIELFPVRGVHTRGDVKRARNAAKNRYDVVHFYVTWQEETGGEKEKPEKAGGG